MQKRGTQEALKTGVWLNIMENRIYGVTLWGQDQFPFTTLEQYDHGLTETWYTFLRCPIFLMIHTWGSGDAVGVRTCSLVRVHPCLLLWGATGDPYPSACILQFFKDAEDWSFIPVERAYSTKWLALFYQLLLHHSPRWKQSAYVSCHFPIIS